MNNYTLKINMLYISQTDKLFDYYTHKKIIELLHAYCRITQIAKILHFAIIIVRVVMLVGERSASSGRRLLKMSLAMRVFFKSSAFNIYLTALQSKF